MSEYKTWWSGDQRVEYFMDPVNEALNRSGLKGQKRTDVYNSAYEAVYNAIKTYETLPDVQQQTTEKE